MPSAEGEIDRPIGREIDRQPKRRITHGLQAKGILPGQEAIESKTVGDATSEPWKWICSLRLEFRNAWRVGTGFLVAPRLLLTAGHNLFADGARVSRVVIRPGQTGSAEYLAEAIVSGDNVGHLADYDQCGRDIGWIVLNQPFDSISDFMPCTTMAADDIKTLKYVNVCGYPDQHEGFIMEHGGGQILGVRDGSIYYGINTHKGQSGSPIWGKVGGRRFAIGVHAYGYHADADYRHPCITLDDQANAGPLISDEILTIVNRSTGTAVA